MRCVIWYHLYNLKSVRNTHPWRRVTFRNTPTWVFFTFVNCKNDTKSPKTPHMLLFSISLRLKSSTFLEIIAQKSFNKTK